MKKALLCLALSICSFVSGLPMHDRILDPNALSKLTAVLDIAPDADLIQETQKHWLRRPGQERWEMNELPAEKRAYVLQWATEQGLFAPWTPSQTSYDKALILGATTSRMQGRLQHLKTLWEQGIRFQEIVWLLGDRPLDPRVDTLTERARTESEVAQILWQEAELPQEMRELPVVFVAVPMKREGDTLKRPTTEDTIQAWIRLEPTPCSALFVSDQPFCGYQFAVVKSCLPASFSFDVVGEGVDPNSHPASAAITLDSIARWLYQEHLNAQKH